MRLCCRLGQQVFGATELVFHNLLWRVAPHLWLDCHRTFYHARAVDREPLRDIGRERALDSVGDKTAYHRKELRRSNDMGKRKV